MTILLIIIGALIVVFLLDMLLTGGSVIAGTMHGMAMMGSHPIGQAILLVLIVILGVLVYAVFLR